jgi:hypothetical protein
MRVAPKISIDDALTDRQLLGAALEDLDSWSTWRVILKAAFGEPLTDDELSLFKTLAGGRSAPAERVSELWVVNRLANLTPHRRPILTPLSGAV